jgi:hypothetical protein
MMETAGANTAIFSITSCILPVHKVNIQKKVETNAYVIGSKGKIFSATTGCKFLFFPIT